MKIAKEFFIMALLFMIVVFMVGIIFYEYMPNNKTVPEPITYTADSTTTSILQEISAINASLKESDDGSGAVEGIIKSYSIGKQDLATAASKHSYTSGKTDPFEAYVEPDPNSTNSTNTTNTVNTNTTKQQGTTDSKKGSSTGTFFEKSNSK